MKVKTFGEKSRYALILMKKDAKGKCIDDTITYYNTDDMDELKEVYDNLQICQEHHIAKHTGIYLDIDCYDYKQCKYITRLVRGW